MCGTLRLLKTSDYRRDFLSLWNQLLPLQLDPPPPPVPSLPPTLCLDSSQSADLLRLQIFCSWRLYARQSAYFEGVCVCVCLCVLFCVSSAAPKSHTHLCKDDTCPHTCAPLKKDNSSSADTRPADGCWVLWLRGVFVCWGRRILFVSPWICN